MGLLKKLFGTSSEKELRAIKPIVDKIEALDGEYSKLTDEQLKAKTPEFKQRIANGESLDDILPEAFAACREAAWRVLGMKPYRVQLIGGIILHQGRIAEMKTGEGKTLVATLPAYLNALAGEGVHIVTVNDYLAKRDSEWMGKVYRFLGLTVGLVIHDIQPKDRKASYSADITYGTNNEFGFDYLRDNMAIYATEMVQRGHAFAIVDEVDSILIDEARTPLIISGQGDKSTQLYTVVDAFVAKLKGQRVASVDTKEEEDPDLDADYVVDEKARTVTLTARGIAKAEQQFQVANLADPENTTLSHHINQAIRARGLMRRDIDYVVKDGEVIIVDEFTGRLMYGRRYSEGLHQAIEAKEGVTVARESKTLATITFQNYFRLYDKLSGMTGTAMTEEEEFGTIYSLDIVEIPTNRPVQRVDHPDVVYKTEAGKFRAIVNQIEECHKKGQPVLVGTISIEKSEELSAMLKKRGIKHNVLNAKFHEKEAEIVAQAGKLGAVTVATNMAGRGTDIMLGGNAEYLAKAELRKAGLSDELIAESTGYADTDNEEILNARKMFAEAEAKYKDEIKAEADQVRAAGGLFILGTERHESRRIDNQLRGRAGRQGDPGSSCFYLSMEDQLLRIFGGDRMRAIADKLRLEEGEAIESKMLTRMIESAQRKVEGRNYDIRKQLLEFDDVQNDQRHEIYGLRNQILESEDISELVKNLREGLFTDLFRAYVPAETVEEQWDLDGLQTKLAGEFGIVIDFKQLLDSNDQFTDDDLLEALLKQAEAQYVEKEQMVGHEAFTGFARSLLLQILDQLWRQHISALEALRQGIYLRGYAQKQPKQEYKREAFNMFEQLLDQIRETLVRVLMQVQINVKPAEEPAQQQPVEEPAPAEATGSALENMPKEELDPALFAHVGRNDPCPCGSGRRFKDCHGRLS